MKKAPLPANEKERLKALKAYKVLDTKSEKIFDDITKLASTICQTKISLVSLIDEDRQWFKSKFGLAAEQTPRDISFCGHAIMADDVFVVENAENDERFCDNPLFTGEPHVRFYAGAPLITPQGHRIGTLCVIDSEEKQLNDVQIDTLRILAKNVVNILEINLKNYELRNLQEKSDQQKQELEDSKKYLDLAVSGGNIGIWDWSLKDNTVNYNEQWATMLGYNLSEIEMKPDTWKAKVHPDDLTQCLNDLKNYIDGKTDFYENIHRMKNKEGKWIYTLDRGSFSEWDKNGKPTRFTGTHTDITNSESYRKKLSLFFENSPFGYAFCDMGGKLLEINKRYADIISYSVDEAMNLSYWDITPQKYEAQEGEQLEALTKTGRYGPYRKEYRKKDGTLIPVELNGFIVEDYDGVKGIWSTVEDISEKKALENQLIKNSKMASLGTLVAGVGHEINNPMAVIKGYLSILKKSISDDKQLATIEKIDKASDRITKIVKDLRTYTHSAKSHSTNFSLVTSINDTISMLEDIYKKEGIEILWLPPEEENDFLVDGDIHRIQQVLMNLISNAKSAIRKNHQGLIKIFLDRLDGKFQIKVIDNGDGIDKKVADRIFDPFFTTKEVNEGTGLGLSIAESIISSYNGKLYLNETSQSGTTFVIEFPLSKSDELVAQSDDTIPISKNGNVPLPYSILLVDDEDDIRELLNEILVTAGAQVLMAKNGKEALDIFNKDPQQFDIILSDVKMPDMDGIELLDEIRNKKDIPQPSFFLITGGVDNNLEDEDSEVGKLIDGYFLKPFDEDEIIEKLKVFTQSKKAA